MHFHGESATSICTRCIYEGDGCLFSDENYQDMCKMLERVGGQSSQYISRAGANIGVL